MGARSADGRVAGAGAVYIVAGRAIPATLAAGRREMEVGGQGTVKIGGDQLGARLGSKRRFFAAGDHDGAKSIVNRRE